MKKTKNIKRLKRLKRCRRTIKYRRRRSTKSKNIYGGNNDMIKNYKYINYSKEHEGYLLLNPFNLSIINDPTGDNFIGVVRMNQIGLLNEHNDYGYIPSYKANHNKFDYFSYSDLDNIGPQGDVNKFVVPGNSNKCLIETIEKIKTPFKDNNFNNVGYNFLWNRWKETITVSEFILINKHDYSVETITCDDEIFKKVVDMRIKTYKINNDKYIIAHGHNLETIYILKYDSDTKNINILANIKVNNINKTGKNLTLINLYDQEGAIYVTYLDWFYTNGIKIVTVNNKNDVVDTIMIEKVNGFKGNGNCDGEDKDTLAYPALSLSTPLVERVSNDKETIWLGVGHLKINNSDKECSYKTNKKINDFKNSLHNVMYEKYKTKYKPHLGLSNYNQCYGYIYMMYFYKLIYDKDSKTYDFQLSDAFLPLNCNDENEDKYKFSLFFPAGLVIDDNDTDVYVSGGEGDYYSTIINFKLDWVDEQIKHNYKTMDIIKDYDYKILKYKNNETNIISDPSQLFV
jgi:hypothetical protein